MRRPHPRFDSRRNAWVTNAGGQLKTLAVGPKTTETEGLAWDAFYTYMAQLGQPVENAPIDQETLGGLADKYGQWMEKEVEAGKMKPATREYYRRFLQQFLDAVGGKRPAATILPLELERFKTSWHSVQTVQRLFNWGVKVGLIAQNPFKDRVERPEAGARERVLSRQELAQLLQGADRTFRQFLVAMVRTIARPQEIRALRWKHLVLTPVPMFVLKDFKGKKLRKNKTQGLRKIPLDDRMLRRVNRMVRSRQPHPDDFVFLNGQGKPWTANAVRCRMRRLREKVGLGADENGEAVVAYTLRHTSATRATAQGVRDKVLAELMGHTNTSTTQKYQHLQADHLYDAVKLANRRKAQ